jgi:hypothetical protein
MGSLSLTKSAIDGQLSLYEEQAEGWKADHNSAIDCLNLEAVLGFGLHIYRCIQMADELWSDTVRSGTLPLRREDADRLAKWYSWWIKPCDALVAEIREFEAQGYKVKDAAPFREACLHVRSALSIPLDRILRSAVDPSAGKPMSEVRDAVRRRLEANR